MRDLIFDNYAISELIETGPVFKQVRDTWCLVFSITNRQSDGLNLIRQKQISRFIVSAEERLERFGKGIWDREELVSQKTWNTKSKVVGYLVSEPEQSIIRKLERHTVLGADLRFMISRGEEGSKFNVVSDEQGDFRLLIPADVKRYVVNQGIRVNSNTLTSTKVANLYTKPKIWIIRIQKMRWIQRIVCAFDSRTDTAGMKTLQVIVPRNGDVQDLLFLNAILSSKLINFYCTNYLADDMNQSYLEKLPICSVDHTNADEKAGHDVIVRSVEQIIEAKPKLAAAAAERDREFWQGKCDTLERTIDEAVYNLYNLTPDEIRLVEGN